MTVASEEPQIDIERSETAGVLTMTLSRDRKLNAITPAMLDALRGAVAEMIERDDLRVLVLAAKGRYFSAGIDIATLDPAPGRTSDGSSSGVTLRATLRRLHEFLDSLESLEKPVIHAAQGPCLGLGLEIAVSCDFRFAAESARFALPEIPKMGVLAGSGGISRLTRLVGPHWARWLAMASRPMGAAQALQVGLVHDVYSDEAFADAVQAFAAELVKLSPEALGLAKLAIDTAATADRRTARDFDRVANTTLILSEQNLRAVAAYRDKAGN